MTQAQAASCASALINAGYLPTLTYDATASDYRISARAIDGSLIAAQALQSFAATHGVNGYTEQGILD